MKKKLKIAILAPIAWRIPPHSYGAWETVAGNIAEGLHKLGHEVTLFATGDSKTSARLSYVCPKPLRENPDLDKLSSEYWLLHIASAFSKARNFDIIHSHCSWQALCFSGFVPTPLVTTLHGSAALEKGTRMVCSKYKNQNYVSISNAERKGAPELNYVATVYNGINLKQFDFNKKGGDYLVFLGRISKDKGTHLACKLARRIGKKLIIGATIPPDEKAYFHEAVEPFIDGQNIIFIGPVGPKKRNQLLRNAYALLHLITFPEPFGLTVVESMACGTPVIAFNKGSMPEVIADGKTGFIVKNLKEAVEAVKKIPKISRKDCRKRVEENFTIDHMVDGYIKVYKKILNIE